MDLHQPMGQMSLDDRAALTAQLTEELGAQVKTNIPAEGVKAAAFALQSSWSDGLTGDAWREAASRALALDMDGPVDLPWASAPSDPPKPPEPEDEPEAEPAEAPADPPEDEPVKEVARSKEAGHNRGFGQARQRAKV